MRRILAMSLACLAVSMAAGTARAGTHGDALASCMVKSTTEDDKRSFVIWMFTALSVHPDIKAYTAVTDAQRRESNERIARLVERLLTIECRAETVTAMRHEGSSTMGTAFSALGRSATEGLIQDPAVNAQLGQFVSYFDLKKIEGLTKEVAAPAPAAK